MRGTTRSGMAVSNRTAIRKKILQIFRQSSFLSIATIQKLLRGFLWLSIRIFLRPGYLFLVYPGSEEDLDGYCPRKLAKSWVFRNKPTVAGIISKGGKTKRGLVLVVPNTDADLRRNEEGCIQIARRLELIARMTGATKVALAGRLPPIFQSKIPEFRNSNLFVDGEQGTVFSVVDTLDTIIDRIERPKSELRVAIIGYGVIGRELSKILEPQYAAVTGIDTRKIKGAVRPTMAEYESVMQSADIAVVLTPEGSDCLEHLPYLKKSAIVVDDTHPRLLPRHLPTDALDMRICKVAVSSGAVFWPRLPGYRKDWLPGCAVEAQVLSTTGLEAGEYREFHEAAKKLGLVAKVHFLCVNRSLNSSEEVASSPGCTTLKGAA